MAKPTVEELTPPDNPADVEAWVTAHEERIARHYADTLASIVRQAAKAWAGSLTAAGDPSVLDPFTVGLAQLINDTATDITDMYMSGGLSGFIRPGNNNVPSLQVQQAWSEVVNRNAVAYSATVTNRIQGATDSVWSDVRTRVTGNIQSGVTGKELTKEIESITGYSAARAETIARTETMNAYNGGTIDGARAIPGFRPSHKQWLATTDNRTRESHIEADGQLVLLDEPFIVGGEQMDRPVDPGGSPAETINCRCTLLLYYPGDELPDGTTATDPNAAIVDPPQPTEEKEPRGYANAGNAETGIERLNLAEQDARLAGFDPRDGAHPATSPNGERFSTDKVLNAAMKREGVDGLPRMAKPGEIDDLLANGSYEAYRGGSIDAMQSFMSGEYNAGLGIYGNGYYSAATVPRSVSAVEKGILGPTQGAPIKQVAQGYARGDGHVLRMAVDPSARIISEGELGELVDKMAQGERGKEIRSFLDPGRIAAANGWDAISVANGEYLVILNREIAVVENLGVLEW
jgi:SPP1 gp7 family putative phage head morphogenesis protein